MYNSNSIFPSSVVDCVVYIFASDRFYWLANISNIKHFIKIITYKIKAYNIIKYKKNLIANPLYSLLSTFIIKDIILVLFQ